MNYVFFRLLNALDNFVKNVDVNINSNAYYNGINVIMRIEHTDCQDETSLLTGLAVNVETSTITLIRGNEGINAQDTFIFLPPSTICRMFHSMTDLQ